MRLSDAIAMGRVTGEHRPHLLGTCAQGMALRAIGRSCKASENPVGIGNPWPWTLELISNFPCGCVENNDFGNGWFKGADTRSAIAHIFDEHVFGAKDWTLDQLIDWVRSVEPPEQLAETQADRMEEAEWDARANTRCE